MLITNGRIILLVLCHVEDTKVIQKAFGKTELKDKFVLVQKFWKSMHREGRCVLKTFMKNIYITLCVDF